MTPTEAMAAKLGALQEIAQDATLASCDVRLAVLLLTKYFNAKDGCAWPSRSRLISAIIVHLNKNHTARNGNVITRVIHIAPVKAQS